MTSNKRNKTVSRGTMQGGPYPQLRPTGVPIMHIPHGGGTHSSPIRAGILGAYPFPLQINYASFRGSSSTSDVELLNSDFFVNQIPPLFIPKLFVPSLLPPIGAYFPYKSQDLNPPMDFPLFQYMLSETFQKTPNSPPVFILSCIQHFRSLPLDQQLNQFLQCQTLSVDQVRMRWQLLFDICLLLRQYQPFCEAFPFGSFLSGLSDSNSDLDLLISMQTPRQKSVQSLEKAHHILGTATCPHSLHGEPFLHEKPIPISNARVPILRIVHAQSRIQIDLSFGNRLGVQNSNLVLLYTKLDVRVTPFLVLLRYWLKFHHLSGPDLVKPYGFTLLGLVYLMTKGILPSVQFLQALPQNGWRRHINQIDGWNASFCDDVTVIKSHFQQPFPIPPDFQVPAVHLIKLVGEFFIFCGSTPLEHLVISPLLGQLIPKSSNLPGLDGLSPRDQLGLNAVLFIQDPFVLNFNVTKGTTSTSLVNFQLAALHTGQSVLNKISWGDTTLSVLDLFFPLKCFPHEFQRRS